MKPIRNLKQKDNTKQTSFLKTPSFRFLFAIIAFGIALAILLPVGLAQGLPPAVILDSPIDGTTTDDNTTDFGFTATSEIDPTVDCTLYLDGASYGESSDVPSGVPTIFTSPEIPDGIYNWYVNCTDDNGVGQSDGPRTITVNAIPICGGDFACTCGDILVAPKTLNGFDNLTGCEGNGLLIGASAVTLDCDGYAISGLGIGDNTTVGILSLESDLTIINCAISGFGGGIFLINSVDNIIANNTIYNNYHNGTYLVVGLTEGPGAGIVLEGVNTSLILENNVSYNDEGVLAIGSIGNTISYNLFDSNNQNASTRDPPDENEGITDAEGINNTISYNYIRNNAYMGIWLDSYGSGQSNDLIDHNLIIIGEGSYGIAIGAEPEETITNNQIYGNPLGSVGIRVDADTSEEGDTVELATITGNKICDNNAAIQNYVDSTLVSFDYTLADYPAGGSSFTSTLDVQNNSYCLLAVIPEDGYYFSDAGNINFTYYVSNVVSHAPEIDAGYIFSDVNCTLYIDDNLEYITTPLDDAANWIEDYPVSAGGHTWYVECNDSYGNGAITSPSIITNATVTDSGIVVLATTAGEITTLDTTDTGVDVGFDIITTTDEDAAMQINVYTDAPAGESAFVSTALGKYITITSYIESLESAIIKLYYTDAEVSAAGLDESSLRLSYYNVSSDEWTEYDDPDGGVDTNNNYVWANVTHFSLFGVFGNSAGGQGPGGSNSLRTFGIGNITPAAVTPAVTPETETPAVTSGEALPAPTTKDLSQIITISLILVLLGAVVWYFKHGQHKNLAG